MTKQKAVTYALVLFVGVAWHWSHTEMFPPPNAPRDLINMVDFRIYYEAARGNDTWLEDHYRPYLDPKYAQGWLYPSWTRVFWYWTLPFTFDQAKWIWLFLITLSAGVIVGKLLTVKGGILIVLLISKTYLWQIETGNADFILAALALSPVGALLACSIKLPLAVFVLVHAWKSKALRKILGHAHTTA